MSRLEAVTGSMFSGKSEELLRRIHLCMHAEKNVLIVKPKKDTRSYQTIATRKKQKRGDPKFETVASLPAYEVESAEELLGLVTKYKPDILAIDEGQFFDDWIIETVQELLDVNRDQNFTIIVAGLNTDYRGRPFGPIPGLIAMADDVQRLKAVCFQCKEYPPTAEMTYSKVDIAKITAGSILVGDAEIYEARCRKCHRLPT